MTIKAEGPSLVTRDTDKEASTNKAYLDMGIKSKQTISAELYEAADSIANAFHPMQARVTGRLCQIAEMVENHFGLMLLEDPEDDEEVDLGDDDEDE